MPESVAGAAFGQTGRQEHRDLCRLRLALRNFTGGERVCDPFCGVGGFILEPLNTPERSEDFKPKNGKIKSPISYQGFDKGFEKDEERTIILAKANMLIYLSSDISLGRAFMMSQICKRGANNTFQRYILWPIITTGYIV